MEMDSQNIQLSVDGKVVGVLPQHTIFPQNFSYLHFKLACLMGIIAGKLWQWYGNDISLWVFDKATTAYTLARVRLGPYYLAYIYPYLPKVGGGKGLQIYRVTLHYRNQEKNQPTVRRDLSPNDIKLILSKELTPENLIEYLHNPPDLSKYSLEKLQAMTIEYNYGSTLHERHFHILPYNSANDDHWFGIQSFLPDSHPINEDYTIKSSATTKAPLNSLSRTIRAYLARSPVPSEVVAYLVDNPEVFQIPTSLDSVEKQSVISYFFEQKEPIILEDDLGDLLQIGMFE